MIIAVCIASIGRPSIAEAVNSILELSVPDSWRIRIIIADDSGSDCVREILAAQLTRTDCISILPAGDRNIAAARNTCLGAVGKADFVGFIDDDEVAEPSWLRDLVDELESRSADVVFGPVRPIFLSDCPVWAPRSGVFRKDPAEQQAPVRTGSTCNALMRWSDLVREKRFDHSLGVTGGEDTQFFNELFRAGLTLIATDRGLVTEKVPGDRMRIASLRARYIRGGQSTARMMQRSLSRTQWVRFGARAALKLVLFGAMTPIRFRADRGRNVALRTKVWGSIGELRQFLGFAMRPFYIKNT